ncbi:MAG TPA: carbohydrate ABC transporter permease [Armatimonadota bacterium]|jgi:ABC-type glycerol-3-phosphate transport system permease component
MGVSARKRLATGLLYLLLIAGAVPVMVPFLWMVASSLKPRDEAGGYPPRWLPTVTHTYSVAGGRVREVKVLESGVRGRSQVRYLDTGADAWLPEGALRRQQRVEPQWRNYGQVLERESFGRYLANTLVVALLCCIGQVLSSSLVGYGFARIRFTGKHWLFLVMLATLMVPGQIHMIPTFMIYRGLGWIDTFLPLIVPAWLGSAFFAFLFRQFFLTIPLELEDAARVDGCSPLHTYWHILLPMARPVTVTVAVYTFLGAWNDFLGPLIYINSDHKRTLSLALDKFKNAYGVTDIPALMAASVLMILPVLLIFFLSQRALMRGMVITGVKG